MKTLDVSKKTVLVFHSDRKKSEIVCSMLGKCGIDQFETSVDEASALKMLQSKTFAFVLVGENAEDSTDLSSIQFVKKLREDDTGSLHDVPIIQIVENPRMDDVVKAHAAGVSDFLIFPFSIEKLQSRIDRYMTRK